MSRAMQALCLLFLFFTQTSIAQEDTYILNGSASKISCNCYTLTEDLTNQSGSVWNKNKIDLTKSFDFVYNVYLGYKDLAGADGIVFILQPISTSVGTSGSGMGFAGIIPSVGISLDTYQNGDLNDPSYDHISIQFNGNTNHASDPVPPVQASASSADIEDGQWHTLRIKWDAVNQHLSTYFDEVLRLEITYDIVKDVFMDDPMVYWGFSGATGGSMNPQQFCTALNPSFSTNIQENKTCIGESLNFSDNSTSFAPITGYFWDFGDGTTATTANPGNHLYTQPGNYTVKLAINGMDGCDSDTLYTTVSIGSYPIADFTINDTCYGSPLTINDKSTNAIGAINTWNWQLNNQIISGGVQQAIQNINAGNHNISLSVVTENGCGSTVSSMPFTILPVPHIEASVKQVCLGINQEFSAIQNDNTTIISSWNWVLPSGEEMTGNNFSYMMPAAGSYSTTVSAIADNGCKTTIPAIPFEVKEVIAYAGNDTTVAANKPFNLQGLGGIQYEWSPANGLSNNNIFNPIITPEDDIEYNLKVTTADGCTATDNIKITVFKGISIYVPNAFTPNRDGKNDFLLPYTSGIKSIDNFSIFDRWGNEVFRSNDFFSKWNGHIKGIPADNGIYIWTITATDVLGTKHQEKGTTLLIK